MPIKTTQITLDGSSGNILIADLSTLIVDATNHRVGIGTATPTYQFEVAGSGEADFFGGRVHIGSDTGIIDVGGLIVTDNFDANFFTGKMIVDNITGITTIDKLTINSQLSAVASNLALEKDQDTYTTFHVRNASTGISALAVLQVTNGTYDASFLMTGTNYTGDPNTLIITTAALNGIFIGAEVGDIAIEATLGNVSLDGAGGALILTRLTTTERDALTGVNGMILYNTTINKFQGYENGAWTNLI